jgi:uracil-DNA glycosylase
MLTKPKTYLAQPHPVIQQNRDCTLCELGKVRASRNQGVEEGKEIYCVGGAGPDDLTKVRLIVISDFPGHYENTAQHPFFDTRTSGEDRRKGIVRPHNAGAFLRMALENMYDLDTYEEVWCTNALKCDPGVRKPLESQHLKPCCNNWLGPELMTLDQHCPTAPILIAGQQAFRAIKLMYRVLGRELATLGFNGCRRRGDLRLGQRALIFCDNPARPARSEPRIESRVNYGKGGWKVTRNEWLYPPLPGSPVDTFIRDLRYLKPYIVPKR